MYTCACPPPCETVSGMMIARIETSRRLQDNWIEQVEDHKIIREEVPRYKHTRMKETKTDVDFFDLFLVNSFHKTHTVFLTENSGKGLEKV